jgi:hypothetical protein
VLGLKLQSWKIVPEQVLLSRNMAGWGSLIGNSLSATNIHYQVYPEAAQEKIKNLVGYINFDF